MHGAKEGGREGYRARESKRKRGEERTRWIVREIHTFGEGSINRLSNRGRVGLMLKLDELLGPLRSYLFKWNICVFIILVFI